ncbi:MAG TPA: NADH-quinone oxidoreductase subunit L [Actinomycetota bacterium]|nr:NADH-quinone oxidoreductase subunit L [Actinomycetota bacterium]
MVSTVKETAEALPGVIEIAWLIPVIPTVCFFLIVFFGKKLKGKGAEIGIAGIVAALALSIPVFFKTIGQLGHKDFHGYSKSVTWMEFGDKEVLELGYRIDGLTVVMLLVVCFVALMVHIYSTAYMKGEVRYTFYYAALSLFTGSMLNLVLANNLLQLLVGWEGVGVCSYLLIGHYWEEKENSNAAIKAFLTTRIGDVGFMFGIFVLFFAAKTFNIQAITEIVEEGHISNTVLTTAALLLFAGAIGKSAQFPLHVWLPDAMAGPTPVSALIHAATMVVAGVYLVARMYTVFHASPDALQVVAIIGAITMLMAALLALIQNDIKRVLAYSTISQLAYMVAALGVGAYTAGVFHIWTHAWFKALLFLGAGSVIHAVHSNNMSDMGGLKDQLPITHKTYLIGCLALAGMPGLAGFWSKDEILTGAFDSATHGSTVGWVVFISASLTAFLTACYSARMYFLTFRGNPKYDTSHVHPHESPAAMTTPLILLAVLAVAGGWIGLPGSWNQFAKWVHFGEEHAVFSFPVAAFGTLLFVGGFALGWAMFHKGKFRFDIKKSPLAWSYKLLENKYYLDDLYMGVIVRPIRDQVSRFAYWTNQNILDAVVNAGGAAALGLGKSLYKNVDQPVIDGAVNGTARITGKIGDTLKFFQTGNVQYYAAVLFIGIGISVAGFLYFN